MSDNLQQTLMKFSRPIIQDQTGQAELISRTEYAAF
jgi:hypothetical protein